MLNTRVGLIVYGGLELISGGYLYDRQLVAALRARGCDVQVFALPGRSYPHNLLDNLRPAVQWRIERARLDLLLEDELCHPSLLALNRWLQSRLDVPIVSIVHHLRVSERHALWQRSLYRRVERAYLQSVDGFVFNSRATAESVRRLAGGTQPSVIAWPSGDRFNQRIDHAAIEARAYSAPPLRIVFLGNVIPRKGLETLIDAVARLPADDWSLCIVGDLESDRALIRRLRQRIQGHRLRDRIWLAGRCSDDEVASILRAAHVLVVPSSYEGFGIAYLEGMSFGLPAIGTTLGGASEIITNGVNGWLVQPGDDGDLSARLLELIRDRDLLARMSRAALKRAQDHPTWAESMERAADFIWGAANARHFLSRPTPASEAPASGG
jgi:glycosyltransferase involved in cell wall biosynthesis